jgi:hypothetical protein
MKTTTLAAVLALAALPALAQVPIACGGVGSDERHAMEAKAAQSNVALEMFIDKGGEYVADVDVTLRPEKGSDAIAVHTDGPICYLHVPAGRYRVEATFRGITRSAMATVPASMGRPVRVALSFPKSVGDQQNDAASPEEKAQAARRP